MNLYVYEHNKHPNFAVKLDAGCNLNNSVWWQTIENVFIQYSDIKKIIICIYLTIEVLDHLTIKIIPKKNKIELAAYWSTWIACLFILLLDKQLSCIAYWITFVYRYYLLFDKQKWKRYKNDTRLFVFYLTVL